MTAVFGVLALWTAPVPWLLWRAWPGIAGPQVPAVALAAVAGAGAAVGLVVGAMTLVAGSFAAIVVPSGPMSVRTAPPAPAPPGPAAPERAPVPVRWVPAVRLTKAEAFSACQALADAHRVVHRAGAPEEATALFVLFELLEDRMSAPARP